MKFVIDYYCNCYYYTLGNRCFGEQWEPAKKSNIIIIIIYYNLKVFSCTLEENHVLLLLTTANYYYKNDSDGNRNLAVNVFLLYY